MEVFDILVIICALLNLILLTIYIVTYFSKNEKVKVYREGLFLFMLSFISVVMVGAAPMWIYLEDIELYSFNKCLIGTCIIETIMIFFWYTIWSMKINEWKSQLK